MSRRQKLEVPFPKSKAIGLDLETTGLDPFTDELVLITLSDGDSVINLYPQDLTASAIRHHIYDRLVIVHNALFDLVWLDVKYGVGYPARVWDTQLAEQMLTAGLRGEDQRGIGLKDLALQYLGVELDKSLQTSFEAGQPLSEAQLHYASEDARVLVPIAREQHKKIKQEKLQTIWQIESQALTVFCDMKRRGIRLDLELFEPLLREAEKRLQTLQAALSEELTYWVQEYRIAKFDAAQAKRDAYEAEVKAEEEQLAEDWELWVSNRMPVFPNFQTVPPDWEESWWEETIDKDGKPKGLKRYIRHHMKLWRQEHKRPLKPKLDDTAPIDLNSAPQLLSALQQMLGQPIENTRTATLKYWLGRVEDEETRETLRLLLEYRDVSKFVSAFGQKLIDKLDADGVLRPDFNPYGTATGRPTSYSPNILQIPTKGEYGKQIRRAFKPVDSSNVFIVCDYSGMELRILADMSGDKVMRDIFARGEDFHSSTAQRILGREEITDTERKMAKICNFLTIYGGEANKLRSSLAAGGIFLSLEECKAFLTQWRETFHQAWAFIQKNQQMAVTKGYTCTPLGRRRYFEQKEGMKYGVIERAGGNFPIQGANADATKIAMKVIHEALKPLGGRVVINVYDEVVSEVPAEYAELAAKIVTDAMTEAAQTFIRSVPVEVDCHICNSWDESDLAEIGV